MHSIVTSLNNAITLAGRLKEISKNIADAEFRNVLADLSIELADTKLALADVTEENAKLKSELTKLNHSKGVTPSELKFKDFAYYTEEDDGPFCPGCYDTSKKRIRLSALSGPFKAMGSHDCPSCRNVFGGASHF